MITTYNEAHTKYEIVQRVIDRIRDEGTSDTVPNLWDSVALALTEIGSFLRNRKREGHNHADGFYKIGFQRLFGAPAHVTRAVEQYHEALDALRSKRASKR